MENTWEASTPGISISVLGGQDKSVPMTGAWQWLFAYIPESMKAAAAAAILKVVLGVDLSSLTGAEQQVLFMCGIRVPEAHHSDPQCLPPIALSPVE